MLKRPPTRAQVRRHHDRAKQHVLAEGVESGDEAERLRQAGFDLGQGYYWSHPVPIDSIENFALLILVFVVIVIT